MRPPPSTAGLLLGTETTCGRTLVAAHAGLELRAGSGVQRSTASWGQSPEWRGQATTGQTRSTGWHGAVVGQSWQSAAPPLHWSEQSDSLQGEGGG